MDLWLWPKRQNFQKWLVPLSFSRTFKFWNPTLCSRLGNCANCLNSRKLTFAQILTKSQNFQEGPVFPYFSWRLWFWGLFLHLRIQNCSNSVIRQLLALMWTLTKNQMFKQSLSYLDFHIGSDCEIHLFVFDLETTYVTHFPEVPTVSKS